MSSIKDDDLKKFFSNNLKAYYNWHEVDEMWKEVDNKNRYTAKFKNDTGLNFVYKLSYELAIRNSDVSKMVNLLDSIFSFYKKYYNPQQNTFKEIKSDAIFIEKLTDEINYKIKAKIIDEILDCIIEEAINDYLNTLKCSDDK